MSRRFLTKKQSIPPARPEPLSRFDAALSRDLLRWFADLPMPERLEVLYEKEREAAQFKHGSRRMLPQEADMLALLKTCERWSVEAAAFASSKNLPPESLARLSRRRLSRAVSLAGRHSGVKSWLARHWGKIVEMKNNGASFRVIARCLEEENHVRISHATIWLYWRQWEEQGGAALPAGPTDSV